MDYSTIQSFYSPCFVFYIDVYHSYDRDVIGVYSGCNWSYDTQIGTFSNYFFLGIDVTANQDEISDHETFQLEYDAATGRWYIRTMGDRYWTLETAGGIQASSSKK